MTEAEIRSLANGVLQKVVKATKLIRGIGGGIRGVIKCAPAVVHEVEALGRDLKLAGPDKKALAVEVIMRLLPAELPWWSPEWLVRWLLGRAIEAAVTEMNKVLKRAS